jgi:hypothetical protein
MPGTHRYRFFAAALALALAAPVLCGNARAETIGALYAKAKAEGALSLYAGGPTAPWERDAASFNALYPGITVTITGGYSNVLDKKIDAQLAAKKVETDLAIFQTLGDFLRWRKEGVLLRFKPAGFDKIDREFKDGDGAFVGVAVNAHPYAYNPNLVPAAEVPKSALDFLKPEFRDKVISAYPADDDATMYVFYSIVRKYSWSYMDKYMANQPQFIQGHLGVVRAIASGDALVTFDTVANISMDRHLVGALGRAAALRLEAGAVDEGGQRLPRIPERPGAARRLAQAFRGLYRPGPERRRGAVESQAGLGSLSRFTPRPGNARRIDLRRSSIAPA